MGRKYAELRERLSPEVRAASKAKAARMRAEMPLNELRQARRLSQVALAKAMDSDQPNISRIEHQADTYVSTLRGYIAAMGGRLDIVASFPDGEYRINQFEEIGDLQEA
jgi:transcriptional regulator with XRE-family HTH domain